MIHDKNKILYQADPELVKKIVDTMDDETLRAIVSGQVAHIIELGYDVKFDRINKPFIAQDFWMCKCGIIRRAQYGPDICVGCHDSRSDNSCVFMDDILIDAIIIK